MEIERILVVDDEEGVRKMIAVLLQKEGYQVSSAGGGEEALEVLGVGEVDLVLCDVRMPGVDGLQVLSRIRSSFPEVMVIMMSAFGTVDLAVEAMKKGAYDYISKPFKPDEILLTLKKAQERESLRRENIRLREQIEEKFSLEGLVAKSPQMKKVLETARKVAEFRSHVLITGESGTGKEVLARTIHRLSPLKGAPFVAVNCGAVPPTLLESEFFGHVRGAFTDAVSDKPGLFEEANGGILFLDEIGDLPLDMQVKFLRAIQEGEIRRVGGNTDIEVDVRIVAATAVDLAGAVKAGKFREDLFYRLNVVPIVIPPLRERREDIRPLAEHLVKVISQRLGGAERFLSKEAMKALLRYPWPGNVRELENLLERASILSGSEELTGEHIVPLLTGEPVTPEGENDQEVLSIKKSVRDLERSLIVKALKKTQYNRSQAARLESGGQAPGDQPPGPALQDQGLRDRGAEVGKGRRGDTGTGGCDGVRGRGREGSEILSASFSRLIPYHLAL
jgi:two-component system response regulator AtoC